MTLVAKYQTSFFENPLSPPDPGIYQNEDGSISIVQPNGSTIQLSGGTGYLTRRAMLFTESSGSGVYTASVTVPPGTSILDCAVFCLNGPWQAAIAHLKVGDEDFPDNGYIPPTDLVGVLNETYVSATPVLTRAWSNPNVAGGQYSNSANLYSIGNAVYGPTVRYPDGATVTATVTAIEGGPIVASDTNDPDGFPGVGYAPGDTGTIEQGDNSSAHYRVDTVDGGGAVTAYTITDPGTVYATGVGLQTTTSGGGEFLQINVTAVDVQPVTDPGVVVVDVIGFGVPTGPAIIPVKS